MAGLFNLNLACGTGEVTQMRIHKSSDANFLCFMSRNMDFI